MCHFDQRQITKTSHHSPHMQQIVLNFLPISTNNYTISCYRTPSQPGEPKPNIQASVVRRSIECEGNREFYWTSFESFPNSIPTNCRPLNNTYLTLDAIRQALITRCEATLPDDEFAVTGKFLTRVEIVCVRHQVGNQVISLEPHFLRAHKRFGILVNFKFHPHKSYIGSLEALQLSLTLDKAGAKNKNYYADKFVALNHFINQKQSAFSPLTLPGGCQVEISLNLFDIKPTQLTTKSYIVGSNHASNSQFMGVKNSGPYDLIPDSPLICFLYRQEDRPLSHDLFRALRGDTFRTFPGMQSMFQIALDKSTVTGFPISHYSSKEIEATITRVRSQSSKTNIVPVVLTPFSKHDDHSVNDQYWKLKHSFLSNGIPIQVVSTDTVANRNKLKWATAGIALQIFAKAGGTPWQVQPRTERCLIVGIGQAHKYSKGRFSKYFAYSVLTDSNGVFKTVKVLGEHQNEDLYIEAFVRNLRNIFESHSNDYSHFVIHSTFAIRRRELESIAMLLSDLQEYNQDQNFAALKFDDRSRFFGFAANHNSRVPFESTMLQLAHNEYLVYFEGLQYQRRIVQEMPANPVHITFTYPQLGLAPDTHRAYLQDAVNLSGANWRGFNAKSLPVSVYYAKIIARYLKEFEARRLPPIDVNHFSPWFL